MKNPICALCFSLLVFFTLSSNVFPKSFVALNRIEGRVYDPDRAPVDDVYVELLNDVSSVLERSKTTSGGRFVFSGMPAGRYTIKVLPLGTNLLEQTQEVLITNLTRSSNDTSYIDIYLRYDKRHREPAVETNREVIFVQEIPAAAKKLYQEGIADSGKNKEKGLAKVEEAINLFPNYFDALHWLGKEYISLKKYEKGYPYLLKAIDINPRSYSSFYSLGYAFYQLKQYPAALEAAKATTLIAPDSGDAQLLYGTVLRITGNYTDAEKALLRANSITKGMSSQTHWQLALLYNRLNRNQETVIELEIFLKLDPNSPDKKKVQEMIEKLKASANSSK